MSDPSHWKITPYACDRFGLDADRADEASIGCVKESETNWLVWLFACDLDYDYTADQNVYPFDTTVHEPYHGNAPTTGEFSIWQQGDKLCAVRVDPVTYHRYVVDDEHGVAWIRNNYINPVIVYTRH